jgi:uncharacterized transporter YbjL
MRALRLCPGISGEIAMKKTVITLGMFATAMIATAGFAQTEPMMAEHGKEAMAATMKADKAMADHKAMMERKAMMDRKAMDQKTMKRAKPMKHKMPMKHAKRKKHM